MHRPALAGGGAAFFVMPAMLVDSHCHLDFPALVTHLPDHLAEMQRAGVIGAVCVGVNLEDFPPLLEMVVAHPQLLASVGVHPEYTETEEPDVARLTDLARHPKVIAIGETGLDYYWHKDRPAWQRERFRTHIHAARAVGKPLIVHTRDSAADTLQVLQAEAARDVGGIMHCFTESREVARQALDLGFYISFSGIVTFKNASIVHETARYVPQDRLLVETDAPYLAPAPHRGKQNHPAYVRHVAEGVARLRGVAPEVIAEASTENFFRLFPAARNFLTV